MNKEQILEIIRFFRPKFYNRITWLVVGSGLGILGKPIFLEFLNNLFEANWNFTITGQYDEIVGVSLVIIGLAYNVIVNRKFDLKLEEEKELREHDKAIFKRLDQLISEDFFDNFLNILIGSEQISFDSNSIVHDFIIKSKRTVNRYLIKEIEKSKNEFLKDLEHLMDFVGDEFFTHHVADVNVMRPELNIDRGGSYSEENQEKYIELKEVLRKRGFTAEKSFIKYRKSVKKKLKK